MTLILRYSDMKNSSVLKYKLFVIEKLATISESGNQKFKSQWQKHDSQGPVNFFTRIMRILYLKGLSRSSKIWCMRVFVVR